MKTIEISVLSLTLIAMGAKCIWPDLSWWVVWTPILAAGFGLACCALVEAMDAVA